MINSFNYIFYDTYWNKKCSNYQLNYVIIMTVIIMIYDDYVKLIYYNVLCNTSIHTSKKSYLNMVSLEIECNCPK